MKVSLQTVLFCCSMVSLALYCHVLPSSSASAQSFTPEHPKVAEMVSRGVKFLATRDRPRQIGMYENGAPILAGYAILGATGDAEHETVRFGIEVAQRVSRSLKARLNWGHDSKIVYEASVASVLLASVDAVKYRREIEAVREWLVQNQKSHGGFGYPDRPSGDTSQVQYAMLALWTMHQAGIPVPMDTVENTLRYLVRTQDPGGGWGYEGILGNGLVPQTVTKSLATAGSGAIIMGGDILSFYGTHSNSTTSDDGIPAAFVRIDDRDQFPAQRRRITMNRSDTDKTISAAIRYQESTANQTNIPQWYFYWRYAQERYQSFREIYEGKTQESPAWYNQGVKELIELQEQDGSWGGAKRRDHSPPEVSTAFAILFLIRSTQKVIGVIDEGFLLGGYGLPANVATVQRVGDKIVSTAEMSVANLLETLESNDVENLEIGLVPENLQLSTDEEARETQLARLSRLLFSQDWKARRIAAKLLGRSDDIHQAPNLIQALRDEDPQVPALAEESLRLISRKLTVRLLDYNATSEQKRKAFEYWKAWYLGLWPNYEFLSP